MARSVSARGEEPAIAVPGDPRKGILLMLAGIALFACGEGLVKALTRDYHVLQVVWGRYTFHALVFLAVFARTGIVSQMRTGRPGLQATRSGLLLVATMFFFTAVSFLPLADAVAINFVSPLFVTALSIPILKEHVGARRWVAICIGFAGVLIIIRPGLGVMHWAAVLPLGTAACYATYQVLTRIVSSTDAARTSLFWTSAFGVVVTSAAVPFVWIMPDARGWAMMVATGFLFGLGHYLVIRGLEVAPASLLSPFAYTQLIWVTIIGYAAFDQFPDAMSIAGGLIVIASGLYVWHREARLRARALS